MRLNTKVHLVDTTFVAKKKVLPTECLLWIPKSQILSPKSIEYPHKNNVQEALQGYQAIPLFNKVEFATHAWFAARTNFPLAPLLFSMGLDTRQKTTCRLSPKEVKFIEHFSTSLFVDLEPMIDLLFSTFPEEAKTDFEPKDFVPQLQRTFEWVMERGVDFKNSSTLTKAFQKLGPTCIVPYVDFVPHASAKSNCVLVAPNRDCEEEAIKSWAKHVGLEKEEEALMLWESDTPVLLLASRPIVEDVLLKRDCTNKFVVGTSGKKGKMLGG